MEIKEIICAVIAFIEDWGELLIALAALVVSIVAIVKSSKAQKLQNRINELEIQIKQYEVDKIKKEQDEASNSCVEARVVTMGAGKHRMKVWNSGNTTVYNVSASFDGNPGIMIMDRDKQPFEELEPGKNYELVLITYDGSTSKFRIITEWEDKEGIKRSRSQMGDLQ